LLLDGYEEAEIARSRWERKLYETGLDARILGFRFLVTCFGWLAGATTTPATAGAAAARVLRAYESTIRSA
jgi:hypothetical protein